MSCLQASLDQVSTWEFQSSHSQTGHQLMCHMGSHVVARIPVPAVLLAVHTQVR